MGFDMDRLIGEVVERTILRINPEKTGSVELFILFESGLAIGKEIGHVYELDISQSYEIFNL